MTAVETSLETSDTIESSKVRAHSVAFQNTIDRPNPRLQTRDRDASVKNDQRESILPSDGDKTSRIEAQTRTQRPFERGVCFSTVLQAHLGDRMCVCVCVCVCVSTTPRDGHESGRESLRAPPRKTIHEAPSESRALSPDDSTSRFVSRGFL